MLAACGTTPSVLEPGPAQNPQEPIPTRSDRTLEVEELVLKSPDGKTLARLGSVDGEGVLQFMFRERPGRVSMSVGLGCFGSPQIMLYGLNSAAPDERCVLKLMNEGYPAEPAVLFTAGGTGSIPRVDLRICVTGQGEFVFIKRTQGKESQITFEDIRRAMK
jgi:hypothetical protein